MKLVLICGPAAIVAMTLLAACGPASPGPSSPAPTAAPSASAAPSSGPSAAPDTSASAAPTAESSAIAPAPKPGVPVDSVPPPGTQPLSDAERAEAKTKCKKLTDAIVAASKKGGGKKRPIDYAMEVFADPPKLTGLDVPRCSDLLRRDMIDFLARTRESEAKLNLKRIIVGLWSALEHDPPAFCASAPAVPPELVTVKDKPYASTASDWEAPGWTCARFSLLGGQQVFQYELRTDPKARTFEAIARGYPVQGAPATEIFISGKVESGAIDPSMPVMRR